MPFDNLGSFIQFLEKKGDLHRVKCEVDPLLEITEIATRAVKSDGPAILFEKVKGSLFPAVINLFGSRRRIEWALGRAPGAVGKELIQFAEVLLNPSPSGLWQARKSWPRLMSFKPKKESKAAFRFNEIRPVDLKRLPIAQSWPDDGGRFLTFPLVITKSPVDGRQNMGVYRMQLYNESQTGMHWQIGKGGGFHYWQAEKSGNGLEAAVVLGADPILMLCGILPLPEGIDEMAFAGFLRGEATRFVKVGKGALSVPAQAEFVLEGYVPPRERKMEGPYGDHFGHYSHPAEFPVFNVKKIYHGRNPVFPIAVVGRPPQEDNVIGAALQEILLPVIKLMHPEIADLWAYPAAGFHNLIVASVRQRFKKEAVKTAFWILGEGQLALSKCVILVDESVSARNFKEVLGAVRTHFQPEEDFILLPGTSQDTLDFTSFKMNLGSKMVIDATQNADSCKTTVIPAEAGIQVVDLPTEGVDSRLRPSIKTFEGRHSGMTSRLEAVKRVDNRIKDVRIWGDGMAVLQVEGQGREIVEKMVKSDVLSGIPLIAAVSPDVPLHDDALLLWGVFTRFDCERDTFFAGVSLKGGHPCYSGALGIDATWKLGYPKPLTMTDEIVAKVSARWKEYGFQD